MRAVRLLVGTFIPPAVARDAAGNPAVMAAKSSHGSGENPQPRTATVTGPAKPRSIQHI